MAVGAHLQKSITAKQNPRPGVASDIKLTVLKENNPIWGVVEKESEEKWSVCPIAA